MALLAVAGWFVVPAHLVSLWMDPEFTGWSAPIAQRIAEGQRLYVDGGHVPIPPLPFLLPYWLFGRGAVWITESFLNFLCQASLIVVLYVALSRVLPRPVPFLAALATTPIYLELSKSVLYDGLAQFSVGLTLLALVSAIVAERPARRSVAWLAGGTAVCVLSKQSTGVGIFAGVGVALLLFAPGSTRRRIAVALAYGIATVAVTVALVLVLSPWASPLGFAADVLVHGSEPKGGPALVLRYFRGYAVQILTGLAIPMLCFAAAWGILGGSGAAPAAPEVGRRGLPWSALGVAAAGLGFVLVLPEVGLVDPNVRLWPRTSPFFGEMPLAIAYVGLASAFIAVGRAVLTGAERAVAAFAVAAFLAAVFHSLSVDQFRWLYDNNPLVMVALAAVFAALDRVQPRSKPLGNGVFAIAIILIQTVYWSSAVWQIAAVRDCTEAATDMAHLKGARLRPVTASVVQAVRRVRALARDPQDSVLVLPNDPDVEAWIARRRPNLTSAIVFVDQYWDRYVDVDFERLRANPPAVIVIGPRISGVPFQSLYNGGNYGAARLITRVKSELLPHRYARPEELPITYAGRRDWLDVYVRKNGLFPGPEP